MKKKTLDWNSYAPGRPLAAETILHLEAILKAVKATPGIRSATISSKIGISSQRGAQLSRMLEQRGLVKVIPGPGYLELRPLED